MMIHSAATRTAKDWKMALRGARAWRATVTFTSMARWRLRTPTHTSRQLHRIPLLTAYLLLLPRSIRGRSRHQPGGCCCRTSFQFHRDGPYVYQRALLLRGLNLRVVVRAGLPRDQVRKVGPQAKRVITR